MKRLENRVDFIVTAREHDRIIPMLEAKGIEYFTVGKHGGKELDGKLLAYTDAIQQLLPIVNEEKPDLLITERWPEAVRTAFGFDIPSWTLFYDEREYHVNWMTFPLSTKIFAPRFYTLNDLRQQGVTDLTRVVWFNGFHTCYLKDKQIDKSHNPFTDLGLRHPIVLVRPEPDFASFFVGERCKILEEAVTLLKEESDADIVVFPRNERQAKRFPKDVVKIFDDVTFDCPVAYPDVTLGAAETMLMESFVLGTPTVSAVYWDTAKPVDELHKYVPHSSNPKELMKQTVNFFNKEKNSRFREMAKNAVATMENPIDKIVEEIDRLFNPPTAEKEKKRRRSRMEIYADVLTNVSNEPLIFSHLLRRAKVTHKELKKDLEMLMVSDLVERFISDDGGIYYKTTVKGLMAVQDFKKMKGLFNL
jgi:predicted glycosyltransferase